MKSRTQEIGKMHNKTLLNKALDKLSVNEMELLNEFDLKTPEMNAFRRLAELYVYAVTEEHNIKWDKSATENSNKIRSLKKELGNIESDIKRVADKIDSIEESSMTQTMGEKVYHFVSNDDIKELLKVLHTYDKKQDTKTT